MKKSETRRRQRRRRRRRRRKKLEKRKNWKKRRENKKKSVRSLALVEHSTTRATEVRKTHTHTHVAWRFCVLSETTAILAWAVVTTVVVVVVAEKKMRLPENNHDRTHIQRQRSLQFFFRTSTDWDILHWAFFQVEWVLLLYLRTLVRCRRRRRLNVLCLASSFLVILVSLRIDTHQDGGRILRFSLSLALPSFELFLFISLSITSDRISKEKAFTYIDFLLLLPITHWKVRRLFSLR